MKRGAFSMEGVLKGTFSIKNGTEKGKGLDIRTKPSRKNVC